MNQAQKNYLKKRMESIAASKFIGIRERHTTKGHQLKNLERIDLLRKGKVKLKTAKALQNENYGLNTISTVFDFSPFEVKHSFDQKGFNKAHTKLITEKDRIIDTIMVGDSEEALEMIKAFEKLDF